MPEGNRERVAIWAGERQASMLQGMFDDGRLEPAAIGGEAVSIRQEATRLGVVFHDDPRSLAHADAQKAAFLNGVGGKPQLRARIHLRIEKPVDAARKMVRHIIGADARDDHHACHARVQILEHRLERGQVEPAGPIFGDTEVAAGDLAAEGCALKVEEPRRALEVAGVRHLDAFGAKRVREGVEVFRTTLNASRKEQKENRQIVMKARQTSSAPLSRALDKMIFTLSIAASQASDNNKQAIQGLLDNQVGVLQELLLVNGAISSFQLAALDVVAAADIAAAEATIAPVQQAAEALTAFLDFGDGVLADELNGMIALADPTQGLAAFKVGSLKADEAAAQASDHTAEVVLSIAHHAADLGAVSQVEIAEMANGITARMGQAQQRMQMLMLGFAGVLVLALVLTRVLITRPLAKISETTEHLAAGDL